ncbi:unnamed protein product [Moneuplotes crassus]|uniref:Alpha-tubulin N-acetyltransferase n=1 Tax=Euplotes crassus TaxID=5936 RepID=A0AAD1UKZ0_EUPCR|nr:unnamed protein product [Moneuplotes crassus]
MEFKTNLSKLLRSKAVVKFPKENKADEDCFIAKILPMNVVGYGVMDDLNTVIDKMGDASSFAQGIHIPITTSSNFKSSEYVLYLKVQGHTCYGLIKTGYKNLFVREYSTSSMINIRPLCILDFYVNEKCQRSGHGRDLFECVLKTEKIEPKMLAYDRPSFKYLSFLKKYYGLEDYFPQSNNFVVFKEYFDALSEQNEIKKKEKEVYNVERSKYFNPYDTHGYIGQAQRKGAGVFSALGSQIMTRTDSVHTNRNHTSPYEKFQGTTRRTPGYSQNNFHKAPSLIDNSKNTFTRKGTVNMEEAKIPIPRRDERLGKKFTESKKEQEASRSMVGMIRQTGVVPQKSKHLMKFSVADRNNKLLKRDVQNSDHLDMYTSTVNRTNARVNIDMQSHRVVGKPVQGLSIPFMWH